MRLGTVEFDMPVNILKPDWMEHAACLGHPVEMFFPEPGDSQTVIKAAKRICGQCPVRQQCLDYAYTFESIPGIWGGKTQRERRKIYIPHSAPNG